MADTIAAVSTGGGKAAVGIIRVSGPDAVKAAGAVFRAKNGVSAASFPDRKLIYGHLIGADGAVIDDCLCTVSRAPRSYTGEDTAELQCHGSPMALAEGLRSLFAAGVRQALPGEFTRRAFLNGRLDLTGAEAVMDVIDAATPAALRNAAGQLDGAVFRRAETIYNDIVAVMAHYHAVIDWPDEGVEDFEIEEYRRTLEKSRDGLRSLLGTFDRGMIMKNGVKTAIIGRPNAGKSSLLNALAGYERAIVTDVPGTTRDTVEESVNLGGTLFRLIDTAGIRDTADEIESLGVKRSIDAMNGADLILYLSDSSVPFTGEDAALFDAAKKAGKTVVVRTKRDLPAADRPDFGENPVFETSAVTGEGIAALAEDLGAMFAGGDAPAGEIITSARQAGEIGRAADALEGAVAALDEGYTPDVVLTACEQAAAAIANLTGRAVREDVVEDIFSRFCVGK